MGDVRGLHSITGPAKCWAATFGVFLFVAYFSGVCASGGGSRGGVFIRPRGTTVPWGAALKVQGSSWAPPPCV